MSATYYLVLTAYGAQRIAQLQADQTSTPLLVNFVAGDANGNPYLPQTRIAATALINQRISVPLQSVNVVDANTCRAVALLDATVGGFHIHEIGIADSTGQLVYIGNYHGGYKPELSEGAGGELVLDLDLVASGLGTVIIIPDPSFVYAGQDWVDANFVRIPTFNAHVDQNNLEHANLATLITAEAQTRDTADQQQQQDFNAHVTQNNLEHANLAALIVAEAQARDTADQQHLEEPHPHDQYVLKTDQAGIFNIVAFLHVYFESVDSGGNSILQVIQQTPDVFTFSYADGLHLASASFLNPAEYLVMSDIQHRTIQSVTDGLMLFVDITGNAVRIGAFQRPLGSGEEGSGGQPAIDGRFWIIKKP